MTGAVAAERQAAQRGRRGPRRGGAALWPGRGRARARAGDAPRRGRDHGRRRGSRRRRHLPVRRQPGSGVAAAVARGQRRRAGPDDAGPAPGARPRRPRRWCSTRSTPASVAPPPTAVGESLADSAAVIRCWCVTHLAQVAALADAQIIVTKQWSTTPAQRYDDHGDGKLVDGDERIDEVARMLSGDRGRRLGAPSRRRAARPIGCALA